MRVLLLSDWMSHPGGTETYIVSLRDQLRAAGDDVTLVTCGASGPGDHAGDDTLFGTDLLAAQAFLQIANPFAGAGIRSIVRRFRPDVALVSQFAYHLSPLVLHALRGVPTLLSVMDYKCICPLGTKLLPSGLRCTEQAGSVCWREGCTSLLHWLRDRPRYALITRAVESVDVVVSCSRYVQRELAENGVPSEYLPLPVLPVGPDFRRAIHHSPLFVYCGRLSVEKGLPLLLGAVARLRADVPDAQLRIVGDGQERSTLERMVTSLRLEETVTFAGPVAPASVGQELGAAWALVAPSLWAEPFGMIAVEAIARGVPVIASRVGGFGESVKNGTSGLLFANGDEDELLHCLRRIARSECFPSHTVTDDALRRVAETHDPRCHVDRLHAIFATMMKRSRLESQVSA